MASASAGGPSSPVDDAANALVCPPVDASNALVSAGPSPRTGVGAAGLGTNGGDAVREDGEPIGKSPVSSNAGPTRS